jgi:hypothetical protein
MTNGTESGSKGRAPTMTVIKVTKDEQKLLTGDAENGYQLNGEKIENAEAEALELVERNRIDWIKEQVTAGTDRGTIAKWLGLSYGVIYGATKDQEGTRVRQEFDLTQEDGTVEKVSRAVYIRHLYAGGKTRSEIQKELNVPYQVVWQATKEEKEELTAVERFNGLVIELEGFADKVEEKHLKNFNRVIEALKALELKPEPEDAVEGEDDDEAEA